MFKHKSVLEQVREAKKETIKAQQEARQLKADLDFVACMCDVEIPEEEEE